MGVAERIQLDCGSSLVMPVQNLFFSERAETEGAHRRLQ